MRFIIHYDGEYKDSIIVEGDTIDEIRHRVLFSCAVRNWYRGDCWSEMLDLEG